MLHIIPFTPLLHKASTFFGISVLCKSPSPKQAAAFEPIANTSSFLVTTIASLPKLLENKKLETVIWNKILDIHHLWPKNPQSFGRCVCLHLQLKWGWRRTYEVVLISKNQSQFQDSDYYHMPPSKSLKAEFGTVLYPV